eukprot:13188969-Alexandrium_andersonii.AAC.1
MSPSRSGRVAPTPSPARSPWPRATGATEAQEQLLRRVRERARPRERPWSCSSQSGGRWHGEQ